MLRHTLALVAAIIVAVAAGYAGRQPLAVTQSPAAAPTPFARFVDAYLDRFARYHPSIAAGNGIHAHDGQLENFSAASIAEEVGWLHSERRELDALDAAQLTPDERVDRRILQGVIDGWLLDLDTVRTWQRNPMIYAAAVSDGVHNLMTMESSPAPDRMRQAIAKLGGVQSLVAAARANITSPPRVFVERAAVMFHGVSDLLRHDLPLAFAGVADASLKDRLAVASDAARRAIDAYTGDLETSILRAAADRFATGTANVERATAPRS